MEQHNTKSLSIGIAVIVILIGGYFLYGKTQGHQPPSADSLSGKPEFLTYYNQGIEGEKAVQTATTTIALPYLNAGLGWMTLGSVTKDPKWYEEAEWVYSEGDKALEGKNSILLMNIADAQTQLGKYPEAKKTVQRAIELSAGEPQFYQVLIDLLRYKMHASSDEILAVYADGMKRVVGAGPLFMSRAAYYRDIGKFAEAKADLDLMHKAGSLTDAQYTQSVKELEALKK
jgi:tetratricopeptide (TPR) repeat protein